jgi:membrane-bound inhibitor of C-type lysozyme
VLSYGDRQVVAFIAESASGARYAAGNVEIWEHQGAATFKWGKTELHCTRH